MGDHHFPGFQFNTAAVRHGIPAIIDQIHHHLFDLPRIGFDRPNVGSRGQDEMNVSG